MVRMSLISIGAWRLALLRRLGIDAYIRDVYRIILGREPGEAELAGRRRNFRLTRALEDAAALTRALLRNPQAGVALGVRLIVESEPRPSLTSQPISSVISLGTHCYTSAMLSRQGLKRFSGPFDWIFSSLEMVTHCLEDDFRAFLDASYYAPVPVERRVDGPEHNLCDHGYYLENFHVRHVFNHTDPTSVEGHAYLQRCVDRLRTVLTCGEPVLCVCVTPRRTCSASALEALARAVAARASNAHLLCVLLEEPDPAALLPVITHLGDAPHLAQYSLRPVSAMGGTRFADPIDELPIARLLGRFLYSDLARGDVIDSGVSG